MRQPHRSLFLLRELVGRDFRGRYAGSIGGFLWSFAQPLWQLALFTFVFSTVMRISLQGERTEVFSLFLFAGLLPWLAVQEGVMRGTTAITDGAELVKKLRLPAEILVITVVATALLHEGIAGLLFLTILAVLGKVSWLSLGWLLVALPLQLALTLGLALLLAGIHVFFRDTGQILGLVLNGWFYLTPIVYPLSRVPGRLQSVLAANPLTALVELYRAALLGGEGEIPGVPGLAVFATVSLAAGWWLFRRLRPVLVDEI